MSGLAQSSWILFLLVVLMLSAVPETQARQDLWLTKAHDVRRTGQSRINGPFSIDPAQSWTAETPGAHTLNIGATVTERGVFFGSWGLSRRIPGNPDPRLWDKSDGKLYGLDLATGASLWGGPLDGQLIRVSGNGWEAIRGVYAMPFTILFPARMERLG